jgi:DNA repair protein RadA
MEDNSTEDNITSVVNQDNINEISKTSSPDLEIQDIQGIGPTTAKKLKEAGIVSVMDLAVTSADELAVDINASKESFLESPLLSWLHKSFLESPRY